MRRLLLLLALLLPLAARADAPHSTASLVAAENGWTPGQAVRLGLRIVLAPGWHTYWSNPGDAGLAPDVSVGVDGGKPAPAALRFPAPEQLPTGPLMGYGYKDAVLLPFDVPAPSASGPMRVAVQANWLVCSTVCVPEQASLALTLPQETHPGPSADAALFAQAERAMPRPSPFRASLSENGVLRVAGAGIGPASVARAVFMPDTPGLIDQAAPQVLHVTDGALTLALHPQADLKPDGVLSGVLAITDRGGQRTALLVSARRGSGVPALAQPASGGAGWRLLVAALAGGLVLNLMPCVFPVLAMKAIALGRHGPAGGAGLRRSALLYTAGILLTFLAVGAATLALRQAGVAVGWGFQFQSPVFVGAIAFLLFGVGLNLAGLFEVGAGLIGAGLVGAGQGLVRAERAGDFLTGVLAVLVATPCTAPFMGAALVAALSGTAPFAMAVFLCLGLGLALPSLVLGFVPGVARILPRPGVWMVAVRQFLSFPMFGATVWLLWVMSEEAGPAGLLAALCGLLLIGFGGWVYGLVQRTPGLGDRTRRGLGIAAAAAVLAALSLLPGLRSGEQAQTAELDGAKPFSQEELSRLRQAGRPVFVDVSAAWCVTCLVNERLALDPEPVREAFAHDEVTLMRGDWTSGNEAVTAFLHRFGHEGVPLYVFFPGGDAPPRVLPQVLTPGLVLDTVRGS